MRRGGDSSAAENNPLRPHGRGTVQEVHRGSPQAAQQAQYPGRLPEVHQKQHHSDAGRMKVQGVRQPAFAGAIVRLC